MHLATQVSNQSAFVPCRKMPESNGEVPRLTGFVRRFGKVTYKAKNSEDEDPERIDQRRIQERKKQKLRKSDTG